MGLFGKKKEKPAPAAVKMSVSADDIFNTPAGFNTDMDADAFFKNQEHKSVKGPKSIKQSTVDKHLELMEQELSQRQEPLDYRAYDKNPVKEKELNKANDDFENICIEVQERENHTRYKYIRDAVVTDMDERVDKLADMYDYLTDENYNRNTAEFSEVLDDDEFRTAQENDMRAVESKEKFKSAIPVLTEKQQEQVEEFAQSDIKAKPIDLPDKIPSLSANEIDKLAAKFEEKYGSIGSASAEEKEADEPVMTAEDEADLARLKAMFG